ncbi:MAG: hypothetical protein MNPFHGCM_01408 [Gemmatimonadaceae bacterium]|nr:hypothetical protein [Gemmatimonadaceae bacterium]
MRTNDGDTDGMSGADAPDPAATPSPDREVLARSRWQELRSLLLDPERRRLRAVEEKIEDPGLYADAVSRVLPEAISRRGVKDRELTTALGPVVGEAIKVSIRKNPQPLVEAIFPIMGPAIRRAIATALSELTQSLNTALEYSLTPRGVAWRIEAVRTGKSFGEVVLRHSLVYRVEQLFVIHPETGLLIDHVSAPGVQPLSPDMVAGMLTAIVDFARDSFHVSQSEGLDSLELGELTVWIERGPLATLACVIRGHAPLSYRQTMQGAVEELHSVHAPDIAQSAASGHSFAVRPGILEPCLVVKRQERGGSGSWRLAALVVTVLLGIGWFAATRILDGRRFDRYVGALRDEPGIVVANAERAGGRLILTGLRDPIARDPVAMLEANGLDTTRVSAHWEPYLALRPDFIARRAAAALQPPPEVQVAMRSDTLVLGGVAPAWWRARAIELAATLAGVSAVDAGSLRDSIDVALTTIADRLNDVVITFGPAQTSPDAVGEPRLDSLARSVRLLSRGAAINGRQVMTRVYGSADSVGTREFNAILRLARARTIRSRLVAAGLDPRTVTTAADSGRVARRASVVITVHRSPTP